MDLPDGPEWSYNHVFQYWFKDEQQMMEEVQKGHAFVVITPQLWRLLGLHDHPYSDGSDDEGTAELASRSQMRPMHVTALFLHISNRRSVSGHELPCDVILGQTVPKLAQQTIDNITFDNYIITANCDCITVSHKLYEDISPRGRVSYAFITKDRCGIAEAHIPYDRQQGSISLHINRLVD